MTTCEQCSGPMVQLLYSVVCRDDCRAKQGSKDADVEKFFSFLEYIGALSGKVFPIKLSGDQEEYGAHAFGFIFYDRTKLGLARAILNYLNGSENARHKQIVEKWGTKL